MTAGVIILFRSTVPIPSDLDFGRVLFWTLITITTAAFPVKLPGGVVAHITTAPIIAAVFDTQLANPFAVCWIAFIGTTELRDIRFGHERQIAWYGTLYNRFAY